MECDRYNIVILKIKIASQACSRCVPSPHDASHGSAIHSKNKIVCTQIQNVLLNKPLCKIICFVLKLK
jgi:hypothetical protein